MNAITNFTKFIFQFAWKNPNSIDDDAQTFDSILMGDGGFLYLFWLLVGVSFCTAAIYYYVIAAKASSATKQNFVVSSLMGLVTLLVLNFLFIYLFCHFDECLKSRIMWIITLFDILYYFILHEIWSLALKSKSKACTIHWISLISNK